MAARPKRKEIALAIPLRIPHFDRVAQGIREFARNYPDWRFLITPETHELPPTALQGWRGAGVIAQCNDAADERVLKSLKCPIVNISGSLARSLFPRVCSDYREQGRRVALFLRERGFQRYGFYGVSGVWYSEEVEAGFRETLVQLGLFSQVFHSPPAMRPPRWDRHEEELLKWVKTIEPPFAVLGVHDPRAAMVINACEGAGLRVPEQVAVIGINNDITTCETCRPTLSSLDRNSKALGLKAAETLAKLLKGESVPGETVVDPGKVHERESTQIHVADDPNMAVAVAFLRCHFSRAISIDEVAAAARRSRRWLEDMFRSSFGYSPAAHLRKLRVHGVLDHLTAGHAVERAVLAAQCGFSGTRQMNEAFEKEMGLTIDRFIAQRVAR